MRVGGWGGPTQSPEYQIMVEYWFSSGELNEFCVYTFIILQIYSFDLNRFHLNCIPCRPRYLRIVALYTDKTTIMTFCSLSILALKHSPE